MKLSEYTLSINIEGATTDTELEELLSEVSAAVRAATGALRARLAEQDHRITVWLDDA